MTDILWTGAALLALLVAYPVLVLTDALRRPDRAPAPFQVLHPVQTGYNSGVPYVTGCWPYVADVKRFDTLPVA